MKEPDISYSEFIASNYLPALNRIKQNVVRYGKDYTNEQFSEMFDVSLKTFNDFYSGKIVRFDLLVALGAMYQSNLKLIIP